MSWFSPTFHFNGGYVIVDDPAVAADWYARTFGCHSSTYEDDERGRSIVMKFSDEDAGLALLGPPKPNTSEPPPIVNTTKIEKAHDFLQRRGAYVGPIEQDAQGTQCFEVRDCCGNVLEVSEEP